MKARVVHSLLDCCYLCVPSLSEMGVQWCKCDALLDSFSSTMRLCYAASLNDGRIKCVGRCTQALHSSPPCFLVCGSLHKIAKLNNGDIQYYAFYKCADYGAWKLLPNASRPVHLHTF